MLSAQQPFKQTIEQKIDVEQRLKMAMQHVSNICLFGSANKLNDIKKTNGWVLFQSERYDAGGTYHKWKGEKLTSDNLYDNPVHESTLDAESKTNRNKITHRIKDWYFKSVKIEGAEIDTQLIGRFVGLNPLKDPKFKLKEEHFLLLITALLTVEKRQGSCGAKARVLMKYLWEHSSGIKRIELVPTTTFDHVLVIVNRNESSELSDSNTWGDAWIVDCWSGNEGIIFHANDFKNKIKKIKLFAKMQINALAKLGYSTGKYEDGEEILKETRVELFPHIDLYPTYSTSPFLPVEYYYHVINSYPTDLILPGSDMSILESSERLHKSVFKSVLDDIIKNQKTSSGSTEKKHDEKSSVATKTSKSNERKTTEKSNNFKLFKSVSTSNKIITLSKGQEALLNKVKLFYDNSHQWELKPHEKIAALIDIYHGEFPYFFTKNDSLCLEYSKKLIKYCSDHNISIPKTRTSNEVLMDLTESAICIEITKL